MLKNYKLLLIIVVCFMFPIACNEMYTKLSVSDVDKVPVDITIMCTKLAASGEDGRRVCTCDEGNKQFCYTVNFNYNKLIVNALKFYFVKEAGELKRIMRDIFQKKCSNHVLRNLDARGAYGCISKKRNS